MSRGYCSGCLQPAVCEARGGCQGPIQPLPSEVQTEPVGWRWKPRRSRNWVTCDKLPEFTEDADVITEPLFTHPAQAVQEPFAWRWNTRADQRWRVTVNRPVPTKLTAFDKIDPLYTSVVGDEMPRHAPQTIETAPKDGTHILAWRVPVGIRVTNNTNPPAVVHWFDDPVEPGFYTSVNERAPEHPFNPTHWERLPDPPLSHATNEEATSALSSAHRGGEA